MRRFGAQHPYPFTSRIPRNLPDFISPLTHSALQLERQSPHCKAYGRGQMARLQLADYGIEESTDYGSSPDALFQLGLRYCVGRDVDIDLIEAHKWFNLAAMRGNDDAKQYRSEISREMSRIQISRAQRMAREWLARN
jgi:uncharacterized protein